jgi:ATP-dependent Lon protease
MKAIQKELSGEEEGDDEVEAFRAKIEKLGLLPDTKKEVERELNRLARMHPDSAEASVTRTYLTWITELPWNTRSEDKLDLKEAEVILGEDHYGLEKVKDRVLEFLAVRALRKARAEKGEPLGANMCELLWVAHATKPIFADTAAPILVRCPGGLFKA